VARSLHLINLKNIGAVLEFEAEIIRKHIKIKVFRAASSFRRKKKIPK